jgi:signal transduction histidine kinase
VADTLGLAEIDAQSMGVSIIKTVAPDLPAINVDPILIEQVLMNLLKNGMDSMKESSRKELELDVSLRESQIVFSVLDHGKGMAPEVREHIFDSFYTTKAEGMGMGLNICRSIIESHQGRLWFEDNPSGGCLFQFSLPLEAVPESERPPVTEKMQ